MKRVTLILIALVMLTGIATAQNAGKVLILVAHPDMAASKANKAMVEAVSGIDGVRVMDVYAEDFSTENYAPALSGASTVVFQFPFYWASAPSGLKKWIDEIFMQLTDRIQGTNLIVATTTGSEYEAYRTGGRNKFTMDELLRPYELTANHSGMVWQTPYVVYAASDADVISRGAAGYRELIEKYLGK